MATNLQKTAIGLSTAVATLTAAFLMPWEGYAPVAKHERIDPPGVITWCFGRTNFDDPTVKAGTRFTKEECKKQLEETIPKYSEQARKCIPNLYALPEPTQAAVISFTYNLGQGNLCKSRVAANLNRGPPNIQAACDAMLAFTRANGKFIQGLLNRRRAERTLCLKGL